MDVKQLISLLKNLLNPFSATVNGLKTAAQAWYKNYLALRETPASDLSPELIKEKNELIKRGENIIAKIKSLGITTDFLTQNLGAIPLLSIGVIMTAAGLMLYWTYDFIKFKDRLNEYRALRNSGHTHEQATELMKNLEPSIFDKIGGASRWLVIGGGLIGAYLIAKKQRWL